MLLTPTRLPATKGLRLLCRARYSCNSYIATNKTRCHLRGYPFTCCNSRMISTPSFESSLPTCRFLSFSRHRVRVTMPFARTLSRLDTSSHLPFSREKPLERLIKLPADCQQDLCRTSTRRRSTVRRKL